MVTTAVCSEMKRPYSFLQEMVGLRRRKRQLQISEPFNFKKEPTILPGVSEDEISVLREKAAASRLGIAPADADSATLITPSPTAVLTRTSRLSPRGTGPLSLSPRPPPRLSIPMPIPIPVTNASRRHGSSSSSSSDCSSTTTTDTGPVRRGGGLPTERMSVSMNNLDLLLFGNPSGVGGGVLSDTLDNVGTMGGGRGGGGAAWTGTGMETALFRPVLPASATTASISPLELDAPVVSLGSDWDMEFDFQLGSPVSPLSPASWGKKGVVGV